MKRWLGLYLRRRGLPLPASAAADSGRVQLQFVALHRVAGFSLHWYRAISGWAIAESAWNSVIIAVAATDCRTIAARLCAYGLWKRGSKLLAGSLYLSLVTPEIVMGISLLALFQWSFRFLHWRLGCTR
jgi:ABC-type spermidine/putrescine transport system permease subunit II